MGSTCPTTDSPTRAGAAGSWGLPSSFLTWIAPPPTAWQLGHSPTTARLPLPPGKRPPVHQNGLTIHWAELLGHEADPASSLSGFSPMSNGGDLGGRRLPSSSVTLLIQTNVSFTPKTLWLSLDPTWEGEELSPLLA